MGILVKLALGLVVGSLTGAPVAAEPKSPRDTPPP